MTHDRYGRTTQHTNGKLTHPMSSNGVPQSDDVLKNTKILHHKKILHYHKFDEDLPDPMVFMTVVVNTVHTDDDFVFDFLTPST
jgi:hypothetical protein